MKGLVGSRVEKSDELIFIYEGAKKDAPLFVIEDLTPGKCQDKSVVVINNGKVPETVVLKGTKMLGDSTLGKSLNFKLSSEQNFYQGDLNSFMNNSGVIMFVIPSRKQRKISLSICLPTNVDNSLQNKTAFFDLEFGTWEKKPPHRKK